VFVGTFLHGANQGLREGPKIVAAWRGRVSSCPAYSAFLTLRVTVNFSTVI
jgi:hypothetical protein